MDNLKIENAGIDAIDSKCKELYGEQKGFHFGVKVPFVAGGPDPLDQVSVYESNSGGISHWHYISYGLTELYEKECDYEDESGFGFELTFRLEKEGEEQPPVWPISLMQNLARYVFRTGNVFRQNEHMDANGPICVGSDTKLVALGFDIDSELGSMDTPYGYMEFIQIVPLTREEFDSMMLWSGEKFLSLYRTKNPMAVGIMGRDSYTDIPEFKAELKKGIETDGSSTGMFYIDSAKMDIVDLEGKNAASFTIGAGQVTKFTSILKARLTKGRDLTLSTPEMGILFKPDELSAYGREEEDFGMFKLSPASLEEFVSIPPHKGEYVLKSMPCVIKVVPTYIKDNNGNVVETIE